MISRTKIEEAANAVPRFKSLPYEHRVKAVNYIPKYCKQIGIDSDKSEVTIDSLTDFLFNQFGYLNAKEMILSLELYASGEIEVKFEKKEFNLKFLGAIFKEYENLKQRIRIEQPLPSEHLQLPEADVKTKRKHEYIETLKWILEDKKIPKQANFLDCFYHLKDLGLLNLTKEYYQEIIEMVDRQIIEDAELFFHTIDKRKDYYRQHEKNGDVFKNRCRELVVKLWLQDQLTSNIDESGSFDKWILNEIQK